MKSPSIEKNVAALRKALPEETLARIIDADIGPLRLVPEQNSCGEEGVNLSLGHTVLYGMEAREYAGSQVEAYCAKPNRITIETPDLESIWVMGERGFYQALDEVYGPMGKADPNAPLKKEGELNSFGLACFGCGLGLHLQGLVSSLPFQRLILIEPYAAFIKMSLTTADWGWIVETLQSRGGGLDIILGEDPVLLSAQAFECFRAAGAERLDGSFGMRHYTSPVLDEAYRQFVEQMPMLGSSPGFVEDEAVMLKHARINLTRAGAKLAPAEIAKTPLAGIPVLAIGNGPSLDSTIDYIKHLAPNAFIISGGTALGSLLECGVTPDLHCEVENTEPPYQSNKRVVDRFTHAVPQIPVLATATVDPRIPDMMGETLHFLQGIVTTSVLFGTEVGAWHQSGPNVANLALRAAAWAGATEVYLFGVDLGSRDSEKHHSKSSVYSWSGESHWKKGAGMEAFNLAVSGSADDTVLTNRPMLYSKSSFNVFASRNPNITIYNCSDGAKLEGTHLTDPARLEFKPLASEKSALWQQATEQAIDASKLRIAEIVAHYDGALSKWEEDVSWALSSVETLPDLLGACAPLIHFGSDEQDPATRAAKGAYRGSLLVILQIAFARYRRLSPEQRADFDSHVVPLIRRESVRICSVMHEVMRDIGQRP